MNRLYFDGVDKGGRGKYGRCGSNRSPLQMCIGWLVLCCLSLASKKMSGHVVCAGGQTPLSDWLVGYLGRW